MGSYVKNDNPHRVVVGNSRVAPNSVGYVSDDKEAELLTSIDGVESASDSDYKEQQEQRRGPGESSPSEKIHEHLSDLRYQHRVAATSAPLQLVVGDDDAPYGPGTGTITTKQAVAAEGPEMKRQFADHEQKEVPEGASEIEQEQAQNVQQVEEVSEELAAILEGKKEGSEQSEGEQQQQSQQPAPRRGRPPKQPEA